MFPNDPNTMIPIDKLLEETRLILQPEECIWLRIRLSSIIQEDGPTGLIRTFSDPEPVKEGACRIVPPHCEII
jgi:hypothetical protein